MSIALAMHQQPCQGLGSNSDGRSAKTLEKSQSRRIANEQYQGMCARIPARCSGSPAPLEGGQSVWECEQILRSVTMNSASVVVEKAEQGE